MPIRNCNSNENKKNLNLDPRLSDHAMTLKHLVRLGMEEYERGEYIDISSEQDMARFFAEIYAEVDQELQ